MTLRRNPMNAEDALYLSAREYPGGVEALALRLGVSEHVLYKQLRRECDTHHVSLGRALHITEMVYGVGRHELAERFVQSVAATIGMVAVRLPDPSEADTDLVQAHLRGSRLMGKYAADLDDALADGRLTPREREQLQLDVQASIEHLMGVMRVLQAP